MVNQVTINNPYSATYVVASEPSVATVSLKDVNGVVVVSDQTATIDTVNLSYDFDSTLFVSIGTYTVVWKYTIDAIEYQSQDYIDCNHISRNRYCYHNDIKRKLVDMMLPNDFDLGSYSARASNEVDRALQGLYVLPLAPTSEMDVLSLRELTSDIAAGYVVEDITVLADNRSNYYTNNLKVTGFAELNRYARGEKEFITITKNTTKDGLHYQYSKPRVSSFRDSGNNGNLYKDPMNRYYDGTRAKDNV
jgi:hypothetical protein